MNSDSDEEPPLTDEELAQIESEDEAAVRIQAATRMHLAKEDYEDQRHAATDMQKMIRGRKERKALEEKKQAAVAIQSKFRQAEAKKELEARRSESEAEQSEAEQEAAAVKIQAKMRQKEARRQVKQVREERQREKEGEASTLIGAAYRGKKDRARVQQLRNSQEEEEEEGSENWLDEELSHSGVTGHLPETVDGKFHRGTAKQHKHKHRQKSSEEKKGLAFGHKLAEDDRSSYVHSANFSGDASYARGVGGAVGGASDRSREHSHVKHIGQDGREVDYIRHAKKKKVKKSDPHKYDPEMFEKVFDVLEKVINSNVNSKDGFGARTIFGDHVKNIMDVFMALDRDKDGCVSHEEFSRGMHRLGLGLTNKQINLLINHMDKDGSGEIEYNEFVKMFEEAHVEHKRVQRMLHDHKKDSTTVGHVVKGRNETEEARRKKQHQELVMKQSGMQTTAKNNRGGARGAMSSKKFQQSGGGGGGRKGPSINSTREKPDISEWRDQNAAVRDQSQSKLPRYGQPSVDPDLLFDDADPFFRDALETMSSVPKSKSPVRQRGGAKSPLDMGTDTQIVSKAPWVAFVVGGPGSSASKICAEMARTYGFTYVSAETAIRDEVASGSSCGKEIIHAISQGRVPVDSTIEVIMRNILKASGTRVLVEGFPQDINQAQGFEEAIGAVQCVIYVKCSRREMQRRILEAAGKDTGDIDAVATVRDARRRISEFEDKITEVLTYYDLGRKVITVKDGPSLLKMCNKTNAKLSRYPAPSRSFGTQTDSGLTGSKTAADNVPVMSSIDWSEMAEKPSPFFNGQNAREAEGFLRGGGPNLDGRRAAPTPPGNRRSKVANGLNGSTGGPRTEKIQQREDARQRAMDGPRSELEKWFNSINIMAGPVPQWRSNFANGYLLAQILELFFPQEIQSVGFHTGVSSANKRDNWRQIQTFFLRYEFPLSDSEIMSMMQAKKSGTMPFLLKVHKFLADQG